MNSTLRFELDTPVRWHPEHIAGEVNGLVVVLGMSQGKHVGFDAMATHVWHRLEWTQIVSELCDGLAKDFDGDLVVIRQDVIDLLTQLQELKLVEIGVGDLSA